MSLFHPTHILVRESGKRQNVMVQDEYGERIVYTRSAWDRGGHTYVQDGTFAYDAHRIGRKKIGRLNPIRGREVWKVRRLESAARPSLLERGRTILGRIFG
jgi:hypothetical protein